MTRTSANYTRRLEMSGQERGMSVLPSISTQNKEQEIFNFGDPTSRPGAPPPPPEEGRSIYPLRGKSRHEMSTFSDKQVPYQLQAHAPPHSGISFCWSVFSKIWKMLKSNVKAVRLTGNRSRNHVDSINQRTHRLHTSLNYPFHLPDYSTAVQIDSYFSTGFNSSRSRQRS